MAVILIQEKPVTSVRVSDRFLAQLLDRAGVWGAGATMEEAVGRLVNDHSAILGGFRIFCQRSESLHDAWIMNEKLPTESNPCKFNAIGQLILKHSAFLGLVVLKFQLLAGGNGHTHAKNSCGHIPLFYKAEFGGKDGCCCSSSDCVSRLVVNLTK